MYNKNPTAGRAVCRPMLCDAKKTGGGFQLQKKGQKEEDVEVPRLPIVEPEALEGKGREVAVAADRLGTNTHSKQASSTSLLREDNNGRLTCLQEKKKKKEKRERKKKKKRPSS